MRVTPYLRGAVLAAALCCVAGAARAHAPLARGLALANEGGGLAVRMPGFGLLVRADEQAPFAYACDALFGIQPTETVTPIVYRGDGSLLIGTQAGLRIAAPGGCPSAVSTNDLAAVPVAALAVDPLDPNLVHAVTAEAAPAIHQSDDGGEHWQLRARLPDGVPVSALLLDRADPGVVYLSRPSGDALSSILVSEDAGATFATFAQDRELVLLHVDSTATTSLWAMTRDRADRTVAILGAAGPAGPWRELLRVNFFGGFAVDADGVIWVGDEGGSVFRSNDGGDSFEDVQPSVAVACLVHAHGALWACTPGSARQRALARLSDADPRAAFEDVATFAQVGELVDCAPEIDVHATCASAWNEWRVDVQGMGSLSGAAGAATPTTAGRDAPAPTAADAGPDAGADASPDAATGTDEVTADPQDAATPPGAVRSEPSGCAVATHAGSATLARGGVLAWLLLAWPLLAARRRFRGGRVALDSNACRPRPRANRRSRRTPCRATSS